MAFREDSYYIEKIIAGETSAFAHLVEKHKDWVYTIVVRILRSHEDAEEIAQDVFMKAYKSLKSFKGKSKFSTWLYSIAYNTAITKTRKRKLSTTDLEDEMIRNYSEDAITEDLFELSQEDLKSRLNKALSALPETDNLIITLYYKNENSIEEISEITGFSETNVKVKLFRIRKKLFTKLNSMNHAEHEN